MLVYQLLSFVSSSSKDIDDGGIHFNSQLYYTVGAIAVGILAFLFFGGEAHKLSHIPTVGFEMPLLSYISAIRYLISGQKMVQEGYSKYKGRVFKVPFLARWEVIVTGNELAEQFRKAPDDALSLPEANIDNMQVDYTFGPDVFRNEYHIPFIKNQLSRSLKDMALLMHEETIIAFRKSIPETEEWNAYSPLSAFIQIVAQNSNRAFVGLPLCRNPEFLNIGIGVTGAAIKVAMVLGVLPSFAKPLAVYLLPSFTNYLSRAMTLLTPVIEQRLLVKDQLDKEEDFLTWVIGEEKDGENFIRRITNRILVINIASIHTTNMAFVHAILDLAARSEYIEPLRTEIEEAIAEAGWTKDALDMMHKVDSFFRESQRLSTNGAVVIIRKALKDFTFSDGTFIPKGTRLSIPTDAPHLDEEYYANPLVFNGFRFSDLKDSDVADGNRRLGMASTDSAYLPFSHGKHACPGRFFAADELKLMLAHLLMTYDLKLRSKDGARPKDWWIHGLRIPNPFTKIMLRKRGAPAEA